MNPKFERGIAYVFACAAFALSLVVFQEHRMMGFWDGFSGSRDHVRKLLMLSFIAISLLSSAGFVYLGRLSKSKRIQAKLYVAGSLYAIFTVAMYFFESYFRQVSGRGG